MVKGYKFKVEVTVMKAKTIRTRERRKLLIHQRKLKQSGGWCIRNFHNGNQYKDSRSYVCEDTAEIHYTTSVNTLREIGLDGIVFTQLFKGTDMIKAHYGFLDNKPKVHMIASLSYDAISRSVATFGVGYSWTKDNLRRLIKKYKGKLYWFYEGLPVCELVNYEELPTGRAVSEFGQKLSEATSEFGLKAGYKKAFADYHEIHGRSREAVPETSRPTTNCQKCKKREPNRNTGHFKCCGRCKHVFYCSRECQKGDWPEHKLTCKRV